MGRPREKLLCISKVYVDAATRRDDIKRDYGIVGMPSKVLPCDADGHHRLVLSTQAYVVFACALS